MKLGVLVSIVVGLAAAGGLTTVFVSNSSPYVTIQDASGHPQRVHVVGKIVPDTLKRNTLAGEVRFNLKDETGAMAVKYVGPPQPNLESATQVVVVGKLDEGVFHADQMLVKCPSKYESEAKTS
ncbi:MAG: cytochrome c maturation protein CcmE [Chthonomonas sp.]|nr:cytochrome c maturation protein CcmE [Chthonomonas sp.]